MCKQRPKKADAAMQGELPALSSVGPWAHSIRAPLSPQDLCAYTSSYEMSFSWPFIFA